MIISGKFSTILGIISFLIFNSYAAAADQPQWGEKYTRNMVSPETGLPDSFDPDTRHSVRWSVPLGTKSYSTPVISQGRIFVGTNNDQPRDPRYQGDFGALYCLSESDGSLLWQYVTPKLADDRSYQDWPNTGIASPAVVEGKKVYIVNNRNQVVCLDINGQTNGNDGPFFDEENHMSASESPRSLESNDGDILWLYDLHAELGVEAHDSAHCSVLIHGSYLYVCTSNGVDAKHNYMVNENAPSLIVLEKSTGRLVAQDNENIGPNIAHSTWSSPTLFRSTNHEEIVFAAGNGICYGFEALSENTHANGRIQSLAKLWQFDCDPTAPKEQIHSYRGNREISASNIYGMPVVNDDQIYIAYGGDFWHGKRQSWIKSFNPDGNGDITDSALNWSYALEKHCMSTPAIHDGLAYITDTSGKLHCIDSKTGQGQWIHELTGVIWASPLVADGKVYIASQRGKVAVLKADREKTLLSEIQLPDNINGSPIAANGILYITAMTRLYALKAN